MPVDVPPGPSDSLRVADLRRRVRAAMDAPIARWACPERIDSMYLGEPLAVRKARAVACKLAAMPTDLWAGQLLAGSMTLESPRLHAEWGFPDYVTDAERDAARARGMSIHSVFGHIVPDYPTLLARGLSGLRAAAEAQRPGCQSADETAFLDSVCVALDAVADFAARLAQRCDDEAAAAPEPRAAELAQMAANLRTAPAGPAQTFWQALQAVWLLHMVFHSTMDGNALGRADQYLWPYLEADLAAGRLDWDRADELVRCFTLKFNERAKTTDDQRPENREPEPEAKLGGTRHHTSSQVGTRRDGLDATNHWLQNIVLSGLTPDGADGTNPLTYLLLAAYDANQMTNPLLTVRLHTGSPEALVRETARVLRGGGGMPALFNDEALVPALERLGIPTPDARDYTNDGCWEVIIPGRTDFGFLRLSLMLPLERVLASGAAYATFDDLFEAWRAELDEVIGATVERVVAGIDNRSLIAPVPLLSALIDGSIASRRDLTAGGAKYRTFALLAESAAHCIDSLVALRRVVFGQRICSLAELREALAADFVGHEWLRRHLQAAPKYGNDNDSADAMGQQVMQAFIDSAARHGEAHRQRLLFPCGVATFSWYVGIGEGLAASPDGRRAKAPVSSNFSPALGADHDGLPSAILSYAKMHHSHLPAGGPLDLRLAARLVAGEDGIDRMVGLMRGFVDTGGSMLTLTVVDTEELRAAQLEPEQHRSLRVRMGGWSAYFTMLSREQQDHHIHRQESRP